MKKITACLILTCVIAFESKAQLSDWEYGGYVKNLTTYLDGNYQEIPADLGKVQNVFQGRLNIDWYPLYEINFSAQSRHIFTYQKNLSSASDYIGQLSRSSYYFDFKWEPVQENNYAYFSELDRLKMMWTTGELEITVGRQRIAWGTCLVWNPTDLFNASNILDFDYPEKPGSDAIRLQYYINELSAIEVAFSPGKRSEDIIYAARYKTNFRSYDFSLITGWQKNTLRIGGAWAGEIIDGGFRGEIVYSKPEINTKLPVSPTSDPLLPIPKYVFNNPYWTAALSYDFTFENSLYLHSEWLYNELGTTGKSDYRRIETLSTGELSPSMHSIFFEIAYNISPLLKGDVFFIINPTDKSWIAAPSLTYSLATNWELYFLAFPSKGKSGSEFGGFPAQYFLRAQYSF